MVEFGLVCSSISNEGGKGGYVACMITLVFRVYASTKVSKV